MKRGGGHLELAQQRAADARRGRGALLDAEGGGAPLERLLVRARLHRVLERRDLFTSAPA